MTGVAHSRHEPDERRGWAIDAEVHTHVMAAWWATIHGTRRLRRIRLRVVGNVVHLPAPIAGYRLRHDGVDVVVEIKPSRAPAIFLARCGDMTAARTFLSEVSVDHHRPFLGEFGRAAA